VSEANPLDRFLMARFWRMAMTDKEQKVLNLIGECGGSDGGHRKQWMLEASLCVDLTGDDYEQWLAEWQDGEDGAETYLWDEGIAP
jgi:hypothetical protein